MHRRLTWESGCGIVLEQMPESASQKLEESVRQAVGLGLALHTELYDRNPLAHVNSGLLLEQTIYGWEGCLPVQSITDISRAPWSLGSYRHMWIKKRWVVHSDANTGELLGRAT